jgi:SsrA-binding protein
VAETKTSVRISIARNRRATYDYELGETFEAGLVLTGTEVKTLRHGQADLSGSWCSFAQGEAFLRGVNIPELQGTPYSHDAKRARKLLLHAREIEKIQRAVDRDGMTVVATEIYWKDGRAKVGIALARGKKNYDKRQSLKTKDADKEARAAMARGRRGG